METSLPLFNEYEFDIAEDTKIQITTFSYGAYEGYVRVNPKQTENPQCITLYDVVPLPVTDEKVDAMNVRRFFYREIQQIKIIDSAPTTDFKYKYKEATVKIVEDHDEFEVTMCEINKLDSVGLCMFGAGVGKNTEIGWICFFAKGVVMALDAVKLEERLSAFVFWKSFKVVLQNTLVRKVMYDHRPIVEFFLYKHKIVMSNYDSLVDLDAVIQRKNSNVPCPRPLSTLLESYLTDKVNLAEIKLLCKFEDQKLLNDNAYLARPFLVNEFAKIIAVYCKHLLELKQIMIDIKDKRFIKLQNDFHNLVLAEGTLGQLRMLNDPTELPSEYRACLEEAMADD